MGGLLELSSSFSIPKKGELGRGDTPSSGSCVLSIIELQESTTELEASNSWISKTYVNGYRPPQGTLNKALGCLKSGQDQEQVLKERRTNSSDSQVKGVKWEWGSWGILI